MKKLKTFDELNEAQISEKFRFTGTCDGPLCEIIPSLEKIGDMASHQESPQDLLKMQAETNKILKMINLAIKANIESHKEGEIDWDKAPKAPVFVLNLSNKYPQHEKAYHDLWYKAVNRMADKFSYGGAVAIFKTYAKRPENNLMLEDHDYGDAPLTEEQIDSI
jgi:hypothetical protein